MLKKLLPVQFLNRNKLLIIFVIITVIATGTGYAVHEDLKVDHISLIGKEKNDDIKGLDILKQRNLLMIQQDETEQVILSQNPQLASVELEKSYPNALSLKLSYYEPVAYMAVDEGHFLLSHEGRILEKTRELNLETRAYPVLTYYQVFPYISYQAGQYIDIRDITASLYVLEHAQRLGLDVNEIDIQSFHMIALKGAEITVYFSAEKDKNVVADEMNKIIKQLALDGTQFRALNLRFERPVIEFY